MDKKICTKCNKLKKLPDFKFMKHYNRYKSYCVECEKLWLREYVRRPYVKERQRLYDKERNQRLEIKEKKRELDKKSLEARLKKPEFRDERRKKRRAYYQRPDIKIKRKIYKQEYNKRLQIRLAHSLRNRIRTVFKYNGKIKTKNTMGLVGCSIEELKQHLEKQFTLGMNWKNYGYGWHIDHKMACKHFDLTGEKEQKNAFHYTNLQPMWALENLSKGAKYEST